MDYPYEERMIEDKKIQGISVSGTVKRLLCADERRRDLCRCRRTAEFRLDVGKHGGLHREMYQGYTFGQASGSDAVPACDDLYMQKPGDDTTVAVARVN